MGRKAEGNKNVTYNYLWVMRLVYFFIFVIIFEVNEYVGLFAASELHF